MLQVAGHAACMSEGLAFGHRFHCAPQPRRMCQALKLDRGGRWSQSGKEATRWAHFWNRPRTPPKKMAWVAPFKCTSASTVCAHLPRATGNKTAWRSHGGLFRGSQLACCSLSWASEGRGRLCWREDKAWGGASANEFARLWLNGKKDASSFFPISWLFLCGSLKDGIHDESDFVWWLLRNTKQKSLLPYERRMGLWWPVGEHSKQLGKKGRL